MKRHLAVTLSLFVLRGTAGANESGVSPQVVYKPSGPASVAGLGESFQPDLHTGMANYPIKLVVPPGVHGHQPDLALVYNSGQGQSVFGLGWNLNLDFIQRQTDKGLPGYTDADTFIYSNNEELVPLSEGTFRLKNEELFARFRRIDSHWEMTAKNGVRFIFGQSPSSRLSNAEGTFRWYVQEVIDGNGNRIRYDYEYFPDDGQTYVREVRYTISSETVFNSIEWQYETRPDPFVDYRSRYPVSTRQRCQQIRVKSQGQLVRTYRLEYEPIDPEQGRLFSLLKQVTLTGGDGVTSLPPVSFGYTSVSTESVAPMEMVNSPPDAFGNGVEVTDFYGEGLPGLLKTTLTGHRYIRNLGGGRWADPIDIPDGPPVSLEQAGVLLADFNGDGFSDLIVKRLGSYLYYPNRGRGGWEAPVVFTDQPGYEFTQQNLRVFDINFDKRPDVCVSNLRSLTCWVNQGEGAWGAPVAIDLPDAISFSSPRVYLADMNGDGMLDLVRITSFGISYFPLQGLNPQGGSPQSIFGAEVAIPDAPAFGPSDSPKFADLNGDGLNDLVLVRSGEVHYWLNLGNGHFGREHIIRGTPNSTNIRLVDMYGRGNTGILWYHALYRTYFYLDVTTGTKPNLLETIDNGLGRRIRLEYRTSTDYYIAARDRGQPWVRGLHTVVPVISQTTVTDLNSGQDYVSKFEYQDGYYSGLDRQFRGFEKVAQAQCGDETAPTRVSVHSFDVGLTEASLKGKVRQVDTLVPDRPARCDSLMWRDATRLFTQETFDYATRTLFDTTPPVRFSFNTVKNTYVYETTDRPVNLREAFDFDNYGNVTEHSKYGLVEGDNLGVGNDEVRVFTDYAYNVPNWIVDRPIHIKTTALNPLNAVAEQKLFYDGPDFIGLPHQLLTKGNLVRKEEYLGPNGQGGVPCTDAPNSLCINTVRNQYDEYGNITGLMDASGNPARLDLGHFRTVVYDQVFHTFPIEEQIHLAGAGMLVARARYRADFGVLTEYRDFNQRLSTYHFDALGRLEKVVKPGDTNEKPTLKYTYVLNSPVSYVESNQRQRFGEDDTVDSRDYFDGLGRKLQTKVRAEDGRFVVKEAAAFNQRMTMKEKYFPYFAARSTFEYEPVDSAQPKISSAYDPIGREVVTVQPDGSFSSTVYAPLQKTVFDEENTEPTSPHYNRPKTYTHDGLERLVEVTERVGGDMYITSYTYDPLGNLTRFVDAERNPPTIFTYDGLSRKVAADDPDRGITRFTYFDTGSIQSQTDAKAQIIQYGYDSANRIQTEVFFVPGQQPQTHAIYHYDSERPIGLPSDHPVLANTQGRLVYAEDLNGQSVFSYDDRGNIILETRKNERTFYTTQFRYDAADKLSTLTYPDPSLPPEHLLTISHQYNVRGLLASIPNFANQITYQPSGQIESVLYGNGVLTSNSYDIRNRLSVLYTDAPGERWRVIQDSKYDYDRVGNILAITDRRADALDEANRTECFEYDDAHRLIHVEGRCQQRAYYLDFSYSPTGNLIYKASDRPEIHIGSLRYGEQAGPHAVTSAAGRRYRYDANGNLAREEGVATFEWDAQDRLSTIVTDSGITTALTYDYTGRRVTKGTAGEDVFYVNQYSEVRNGQLVKYVFAGSQRLAQIDPSNGISFRHFDHLGSPSVMTDHNASITERTEFFAYGEERLRTGPFRLAYTYTDKERDSDSEFNYFGARYFTASLGRFISPDPKSAGADIHNPQSWNSYAYALNNPHRYIDQNGKWPTEIHNAVLNGAFNGLSEAQRQVMRAESRRVDSWFHGGQTANLAYQHGMRGPFESAESARARGDAFISKHEQAAKAEALKAGFVNDKALKEMGSALHTVTDGPSPTHEGQQVWTGGGEPGLTTVLLGPAGLVLGAGIDGVRAVIHSHGENQITLERYHTTVEAARAAYLETFGVEAFRQATGGCEQVNGCPIDEKQLPAKLRK